ncbi:hypothetical protein C2S53_001239 [Perilla frutescens var. hirtella]|uniref:Uncharacterized protein n=1 Tax=Perilla frutescens var. hirtella TaxID=608512 RepID=A0AAD4PFL0_PERFH|nr:hypothetical protein C2S53_001239 [Perilla frutescens var. hirtella]
MHRGGARGGEAGRSGSSSSSSVGLNGPVGDISLEGSSRPAFDAEGRRKEFSWDPAEEDVIMAKWYIKAAERYRDMVYGFKKNRTKGCHALMSAEMWEGFKEHWDSEAYKANSTVTSKNHLTEPDGLGTGIADALARVEELSQPTPGTDEASPVDMSAIYVDTAHQHSKKNRIFGLGNRSRSYSAASVSSAASPQPDTQAAIRGLQEKMDAQTALL